MGETDTSGIKAYWVNGKLSFISTDTSGERYRSFNYGEEEWNSES